MSKSTTRGRQRGRRRNRPLRCEASTRMREWMCYRNHLVRRRGSAHDTSGQCPFHITKFSPGRSCWARESYSCPEYLMEIVYPDIRAVQGSYEIVYPAIKAEQRCCEVVYPAFGAMQWNCETVCYLSAVRADCEIVYPAFSALQGDCERVYPFVLPNWRWNSLSCH